MNSLEAFKLNYQTIYRNQINAKICAITLMEIGKDFFQATYKFNNLDKLQQASNYLINKEDPPRELYIDFALNNLIDSIKIGICFENYFKAQLIANNFLVHKLDSNIFNTLFKEQKKRPINVDELDSDKWEEYPKRHPRFPEIKTFWIGGIKEETVSYSTLLNNTAYYQHFHVSSSILDQLKLINNDRNKLHLNVANSTILFPNTYDNFKLIVDFVNSKIPEFVSALFDELKIPIELRKFQEITERVPIT